MKKNLFFAVLVAVAVTGSAYANPEITVNSVVKQSFQKEFAGAQSVSWETINDKGLFHASFLFNGERLNAYFDAEGSLLATGRYVKQENLPMLVSRSINERFSQYQVAETIEFVTGTETSYIVKLENEKFKLFIKAHTDGANTILKKEKKNNVAKL